MRNRERLVRGTSLPLLVTAATIAAGVTAIAGTPALTLPPAPVPAENPGNEAQRVLGKMLFFEEQLSSDDSVACATCHVMTAGGTDPRRGRNPGSNGVFGDLGDIMGSPGVLPLGEGATLLPAADFGAGVQITPRTAPTPFAAAYEDKILWDGRAGTLFKDPVTGQTAVASGGALESQALLPLTNSVEMGHAGRDLAAVTDKLAASRPLALASNLPPDVASALDGDPTYPELFRRAYGDEAVTPVRVAMAIATYERSLVPDQTKYDRFAGGEAGALNEQEARGLDALTTSQCVKCHAPPLFTDGSFRATGVRGPTEDKGLGGETSLTADRGKFKVPTLRNVALKPSFFHDGQRLRLEEAVDFYAVTKAPVINGMRAYGAPSGVNHTVPQNQFVENQDSILGTIQMTPQNAQDILAFLRGGLVDPRVVSGSFPFDAPTLTSQRGELVPQRAAAGFSGSAGFSPEIVIRNPAVAGSERFTVSVTGGIEGSNARLVSWDEPSADGVVRVSEPVPFGLANDVTFANATVSLAAAKPGSRVHFAWRVDDPDAPGGVALTPVASVLVAAPRPEYSGGAPLPLGVAESVTGRDAFVESARYSVDYARGPNIPAGDVFSLTVQLGNPGSADLTQGRLALTVGGVEVLSTASMDARGRVTAAGVSGRFDAASGRLSLTVRDADLTDAIVSPSSVPVRLEVSGLGLADPVVTTTLNFIQKTGASGISNGRFVYRNSGTGNGVFHVTSAKAAPTPDGRFRVQIAAALDSPGPRAPWLPGSLALTAGENGELQFSQPLLGFSANGGVFLAYPSGDLSKLRIDLFRRTLSAEFTIALPALAGAAPGTRVEIPITLTTVPEGTTSAVSYTTSAAVIARRR